MQEKAISVALLDGMLKKCGYKSHERVRLLHDIENGIPLVTGKHQATYRDGTFYISKAPKGAVINAPKEVSDL